MDPSNEPNQRAGRDAEEPCREGSTGNSEDTVPTVPGPDVPPAPGRDTGVGRTEDVDPAPNTGEVTPPGERGHRPGRAGTGGEWPFPEPPS